jgi:hypothetical protein
MPTTNNPVKFVSCYQYPYDMAKSNGTLDADTLYFTVDTHNVYLGDTQYTDKFIEYLTSPPIDGSTPGDESKLYFYHDVATRQTTIYQCYSPTANTYAWNAIAANPIIGNTGNVEATTVTGCYANIQYELDGRWCRMVGTCDLESGASMIAYPLPVAAINVAGTVVCGTSANIYYYAMIPSTSNRGYFKIVRADGQTFTESAIEITLMYKYHI